MEVYSKPTLFQLEAFNKLRAKSLESTSFFEKFGYSNIFLPSETTSWIVKPNVSIAAEEDIEDNSTNAPESRTISLRSENDICNNSGGSQSEIGKTKKKTIKLKSIIEKMLVQEHKEEDFCQRFTMIAKLDEGIEIWEF